MKTSESIIKITAALIAAEKEFPVLSFDAEGHTGARPYKYLTLPKLLDMVKPVLLKHGIVIIQAPEGELGLSTRVQHESGEFIESMYIAPPLPEAKNMMWADGMRMTYSRRYCWLAILGLVGEDDNDAADLTNDKPDTNTNDKQKYKNTINWNKYKVMSDTVPEDYWSNKSKYLKIGQGAKKINDKWQFVQFDGFKQPEAKIEDPEIMY